MRKARVAPLGGLTVALGVASNQRAVQVLSLPSWIAAPWRQSHLVTSARKRQLAPYVSESSAGEETQCPCEVFVNLGSWTVPRNLSDLLPSQQEYQEDGEDAAEMAEMTQSALRHFSL